jgi:hypothetical protein
MRRSTAQAFLLCLTAAKDWGACVTEANATAATELQQHCNSSELLSMTGVTALQKRMLRAAEYLHASLGALTKHRSAGKRAKYDESAAGICKATARITHVGAPRMLQRLASIQLPDTSRSTRRGALSAPYHVRLSLLLFSLHTYIRMIHAYIHTYHVRLAEEFPTTVVLFHAMPFHQALLCHPHFDIVLDNVQSIKQTPTTALLATLSFPSLFCFALSLLPLPLS